MTKIVVVIETDEISKLKALRLIRETAEKFVHMEMMEDEKVAQDFIEAVSDLIEKIEKNDSNMVSFQLKTKEILDLAREVDPEGAEEVAKNRQEIKDSLDQEDLDERIANPR